MVVNNLWRCAMTFSLILSKTDDDFDDFDLTCQQCGTVKNVSRQLCPYEQDVHNRDVEIVVCPKCLQDILNDI